MDSPSLVNPTLQSTDASKFPLHTSQPVTVPTCSIRLDSICNNDIYISSAVDSSISSMAHRHLHTLSASINCQQPSSIQELISAVSKSKCFTHSQPHRNCHTPSLSDVNDQTICVIQLSCQIRTLHSMFSKMTFTCIISQPLRSTPSSIASLRFSKFSQIYTASHCSKGAVRTQQLSCT